MQHIVHSPQNRLWKLIDLSAIRFNAEMWKSIDADRRFCVNICSMLGYRGYETLFAAVYFLILFKAIFLGERARASDV